MITFIYSAVLGLFYGVLWFLLVSWLGVGPVGIAGTAVLAGAAYGLGQWGGRTSRPGPRS